MIARYRKAIVHVIGVAVTAYLARYGDAIWPIVTAWVLSTLGVARVPNFMSTGAIRRLPNFLNAVVVHNLSGGYAPPDIDIAGTPAAIPRAFQDYTPRDYTLNTAHPRTVVTANPADCTNPTCPIHHPQADARNT